MLQGKVLQDQKPNFSQDQGQQWKTHQKIETIYNKLYLWLIFSNRYQYISQKLDC
jgi:hypothetical protein